MPHFENDTFHVQGTAKDVYKRQTCYVRRLSLVVVERILIGRSLSLSLSLTHTHRLSLSLSNVNRHFQINLRCSNAKRSFAIL